MKNYIRYPTGARRPTFHFFFFDDANTAECIEALKLATSMRGAVFIRPEGENDWPAWQALPQISDERLDAAEDA